MFSRYLHIMFQKRLSRALLNMSLLFATMFAGAQTATGNDAVVEALNVVPVYFVTTASGLAPSVGTQQQSDFVPVFLYQEEARIAKAELERQGARQLVLNELKLGAIYSGARDEAGEPVRYGLVANPTQLSAAKRISNGKSFSEVPVFIAKHKESGEVMTMKQSDGALAVPIFLEFHRIEAALDALGKQLPDIAGSFKVEAYPLSAIVNDMQTGALEPVNVVIIPPAN